MKLLLLSPDSLLRFASRPRLRLVGRLVVFAIGILLVLLPAVLGQNASIGLRLASALFGAALLAIASVFLGSSNK